MCVCVCTSVYMCACVFIELKMYFSPFSLLVRGCYSFHGDVLCRFPPKNSDFRFPLGWFTYGKLGINISCISILHVRICMYFSLDTLRKLHGKYFARLDTRRKSTAIETYVLLFPHNVISVFLFTI